MALQIPRITASATALLASSRQPLLLRGPLRSAAVLPSATRFYSQRERVKPAGPIFDEQIDANIVKYIDDKGVFQGQQSLRAILRRIPRHSHKVQLIGNEPVLNEEGEQIDTIPICKLVSKEELALQQQKAYREKKEKREANKGKSGRNQKHVVKTLEFTWAIDPHDLKHRLQKMQGFFEKGNRVEVTIGVKRGMKKMTVDEVKGLARIVDEFALKYAKEMKDPEGDLGRKLMLFYESKVDVAKLEKMKAEERGVEEKKVEEKMPQTTTTTGEKLEGEPDLVQGNMTDAEFSAAQYAWLLRTGSMPLLEPHSV